MMRPPLRYHGGKFRIAPWIISHFPSHRTYVEPFGGGGSVLLRKPRSYAEVYNDLDGEVVNLFMVLRDRFQELADKIYMTPYARDEFDLSYEAVDDPVEQARRTLFRSAAGFSTGALGKYGTGFRNNPTRSYSTPADNWRDMPEVLVEVVERLRGVVIENKPAVEIIQIFDGPDTLFYCDPPYPYATRGAQNAGKMYRHEMDDKEHIELADVLTRCQGHVVVSGYACELYDDLYDGWQVLDKETYADGARKRVERLWLSPNIDSLPLFNLR